MDLFIAAAPNPHGDKEDSSLSSSLHSSAASKNIPAGAVASVVLWCDGELSKFASAFGGARILANLALSPPPRNAAKQPRVVDGHLETNGNRERQVREVWYASEVVRARPMSTVVSQFIACSRFPATVM